MKWKSRIHLPTGDVFAMDPMYLGAPEDRDHNWIRQLSERDTLSQIEYLNAHPDIGCYPWGLEPGNYNFPLNSILNRQCHPKEVEDPNWLISVDSGSIIVSDVAYLAGIWEHFDWTKALTKNANPSSSYQKIINRLLGEEIENVFALICSPGRGSSYEFWGDGRYFLKKALFEKARPRRKKQE